MKRAAAVLTLTCAGIMAASAVMQGDSNAPVAATPADAAPAAPVSPPPDEAAFYEAGRELDASAQAGREIWYKATAGNAYFHAYIFPQRIGVTPDWYRVLNAAARADRFQAWGLINDPSCCTPGDKDCPASSLEVTYGFQWCPGDDALLKFVGKEGYRDPACDFKDAKPAGDDPHAARDQRQSPCDLAFGTSTGALGLRKFPNPRFSATRWKQLNGSLASWEG
ncbi:MAG: cytochrome c, partial [Rhodocyclaceae bacterium]|nr:cytochrome c [Rhodocyclaceae bacterium]